MSLIRKNDTRIKFDLRLAPKRLDEAVDAPRQNRSGHCSRNTCISEAIAEKLAREGACHIGIATSRGVKSLFGDGCDDKAAALKDESFGDAPLSSANKCLWPQIIWSWLSVRRSASAIR
jgi:hypothetical protein